MNLQENSDYYTEGNRTKRRWEMKYPMNLQEEILRQAREDYINAFQVLLDQTTYKTAEDAKDGILKESKRISKKIDFLDDMKTELKRLGVKYGKDYVDIVETIITEQDSLKRDFAKRDKLWDALMMMESCEKYISRPDLLAWVDVTPADIIADWKKQARREHRNPTKHRNGKLPEEMIQKILELHAQGKSQKAIAKEVGCSPDPVRKYIKERSKTNEH